MSERLLRRTEVEKLVGLKRSAIYERVSKGTFPAPVRDPDGAAVWWIESEIDGWIAEKIRASRGGTDVGRNTSPKEKAA